MKLVVDRRRTILTFIIVFLVMGAALFGICFWIFLDFPWDFRQPLIIAFWIVSSIVFLVLSLTKNYYVLEKKYLVVKRYTKELVYYFSDVLYIDEEQSIKKKTIHFYTRQGHARYLSFDRQGIIYKTMLEKCTNRLSKEEFEKGYPDVRL